MFKLGRIISRTSEAHEGYGKGAGRVDRTLFECPCGKGTYTHVYEYIPGHMAHHYSIECEVCEEKYTFNVDVGILVEKVLQEVN